jgi:hypothetical protein
MLGKAAMSYFDDPEASGVWAVMQVVRSGTRRKTVNALGLADMNQLLYATRAARNNAPSLGFWWIATIRPELHFSLPQWRVRPTDGLVR